MSRHYPDNCSECNGGYCFYARFARKELVLTSVHNEPNSQINEFDGPNQFNQQPPFVGPNHIGSFQQHSHYIGPVQHPPAQQPLILNGPHYSRTHGPDQFPQRPPLINGPDQLPQIAEINNINDINNIPPATNQHIQYPNNQATNSFRNYIQPPLTPVQANIQINNNLQRQQSFTSQASNMTDQPLQDFRNCNCQVCSILKNHCFQNISNEPQNENCVTRNEQNEEVNVNNATVIINNNNPQDSQNSKKFKYIIFAFIIICIVLFLGLICFNSNITILSAVFADNRTFFLNLRLVGQLVTIMSTAISFFKFYTTGK